MGNPEALASALAKIERHGSTFLKRLPWPVNPNSQILRTHPPTRERIRRLLAIGDRNPYSVVKVIPRHPNHWDRPLTGCRPNPFSLSLKHFGSI
jgi:hypothetical protein